MSDRSELEAAIRATGGTIEANGQIRGGNLTAVAAKLGVARKTLHNHMKRHGLKGLGGRPKKKYKRRTATYAAVGAAVLALGVGVAISSKRPTSA